MHFVGRYGWILSGQDKIFRTTNGGNTWTQHQLPFPATFSNLVFATPKKGWLYASPNQLFYTEDGGITWQLNVNLYAYVEEIFIIDSTQGYVAGQSSLIAAFGVDRTSSVVATKPVQPELNKSSLYPNPSRGLFMVEAVEPIQVEVLSTDGRHIYTPQHRAARHDIDLRAYGAGLYLVRLLGQHGTEVRKVIVE